VFLETDRFFITSTSCRFAVQVDRFGNSLNKHESPSFAQDIEAAERQQYLPSYCLNVLVHLKPKKVAKNFADGEIPTRVGGPHLSGVRKP
jgi:hypothetical protein